jgi:cytochrome c553
MKIKLAILLMSLVSSSLLMGADDAKTLYMKKCVTCHGVNGEKKAIGISRELNTLSKEDIETALNGYKSGTHGGKYKKLKTGLINSLNDEDILALSAYIQTLNPQK